MIFCGSSLQNTLRLSVHIAVDGFSLSLYESCLTAPSPSEISLEAPMCKLCRT
jgi:hypothetical protein